MTDSPWPYGTGGTCGDAFAATVLPRQALVARMGASAAFRHLVANGQQESVALDMLTPKDFAAWDKQWSAPEGGA